ncbi:aminotransferase class V-fold PLP-dependent enzyme [Pantoea vagans]|uniref:aminotransferase class V-fold PLP-dependent enzyme n=1 Tax=Pantoea vagans TaxID=470934 RepID=UPI00225B3910|nr:aminotransferase class V-fold PLP-dependent enzyme [Pantoea vagans]MCX3311633.1 aminotransferase class V-fold PLP-dependent enzyme [Pantoea vagans]
MQEITSFNMGFFRLSEESEIYERFREVCAAINSQTEDDGSSQVSFLPLSRLNNASERKDCLEIIGEVISSGCFTSGPYIGQVENKLKELYEAHTCVATASGTDAIKIALKSVGVGPGDEVILPLNSFAATENAVLAIGATPVFANIDRSYNINPSEIDRVRNKQTKAILPVCLYGSNKNMREVYLKSREADIPVVIDAAQCFGIKSVMDYCDVMALSFNPFKNIGSFGKSGAIITRSPALAQLARQYSYHGFAEGKKNIKSQDWGLNSRMDNLQAATLSVKLGHFEINSAKRCLLAARYHLLLKDLSAHVDLPSELIENTWHLYPVYLQNGNRDELISFAQENGVEFDIYYPVLSHSGVHDLARKYPDKSQFRPSEQVHAALIHIPLHNHMSFREQDRVSEVLHAFFR